MEFSWEDKRRKKLVSFPSCEPRRTERKIYFENGAREKNEKSRWKFFFSLFHCQGKGKKEKKAFGNNCATICDSMALLSEQFVNNFFYSVSEEIEHIGWWMREGFRALKWIEGEIDVLPQRRQCCASNGAIIMHESQRIHSNLHTKSK